MPRKSHGHGGAGQERWLVTYADMLTLLLALFIVLYNMSKSDLARFRRFQEGLQEAFHVQIFDGLNAPVLNQTSIAPNAPAQPTAVPVRAPGQIPVPVAVPEPTPTVRSDADAATTLRLRSAFQGLSAPTQRGGIEVVESRRGIVVSIYGMLLFDSGDANLRPAARPVLAAIAASLRPLRYDIRVEGHTDSIPPSGGPYPTNWDLSTARALVVTHFLIDEGKLDPRRLSAAGYAEFRPVASNQTREGRLRNRRVDLVLHRPLTLSEETP